MKMQANTVGIAFPKKDIYIIKNHINNKVYIGQSVDVDKRFNSHCKPSSIRDNSLIDFAIQKYGVENFWYEILESGVENYNERECYWIKKYNSITPNGYNILEGGQNPPSYRSTEHPTASFSNMEDVRKIKEDLKNTNKSLSQIAKAYNVSKRTILRINQGIVYEELDESYPIRKIPNINGKLTDDQILEIIDILQFTYRQYEDIAKQYNISISAVKQINSGDCHPLENVKYPIREYKNSGKPACTYEQVTEISHLLSETKMSCRQIAKRYKVDLQTVYTINNGNAKRYRRDGLQYPLRKHNSGRRPCIDYPR